MDIRPLGATGLHCGSIGFGTWALGADWGAVDQQAGIAALHEALDRGMNFIDTADVYGDGASERLIASVLKDRRGEAPVVATKAGRRLPRQLAEGYSFENLTAWVERSLRNLEVEALDLLQLHCPPTDAYDRPEIFGALDRLVQQGKIRRYGVSVETVDEALKALDHPGVVSIQIIYNIFRQKPAETLFERAVARGIALIVRVPLASGMLSGKFRADTTFDTSDHRNYNRNGEAFDVGETFSGVPYDVGLSAVEELRALVPEGVSMAQFALRWILMKDAVSVAIPGAKTVQQATANIDAAALPPLSEATMEAVAAIYDRHIRSLVHKRW